MAPLEEPCASTTTTHRQLWSGWYPIRTLRLLLGYVCDWTHPQHTIQGRGPSSSHIVITDEKGEDCIVRIPTTIKRIQKLKETKRLVAEKKQKLEEEKAKAAEAEKEEKDEKKKKKKEKKDKKDKKKKSKSKGLTGSADLLDFGINPASPVAPEPQGSLDLLELSENKPVTEAPTAIEPGTYLASTPPPLPHQNGDLLGGSPRVGGASAAAIPIAFSSSSSSDSE